MEGLPDSFGAMAEVLLSLGADLGDPVLQLDEAERRIGEVVGGVLARSRGHWTEPWGFNGDRLFLNRALLLRTTIEPDELMGRLLGIETELGRERKQGEGTVPRTADIDILLYEDRVIDRPGLTVPHPRMHLRAFALAPAADIAPGMGHPILGRSVLELLHDLRHL